MKKSDYLAPQSETVEFFNEKSFLAASDENINTENLGNITGNW